MSLPAPSGAGERRIMIYEAFLSIFINHHRGHKKAIRRWLLKLMTGSDRCNREYISRAWTDGYLILNDGKGKGYYLYDPKTDMRNLTVYLAKELKRKQSLEEKLHIGFLELGRGMHGTNLLGSGGTAGEGKGQNGKARRKSTYIHTKGNGTV